jgi:hypothetical protein
VSKGENALDLPQTPPLTTSRGNEHHGQKMVMMTHDLFETCGHFHLLLNAEEKPNQALADWPWHLVTL